MTAEKLSRNEEKMLKAIKRCVDRNKITFKTYIMEVMLESGFTFLQTINLCEKLAKKRYIIKEQPGSNISLL